MAILARYPHIVDVAFPAQSRWAKALTTAAKAHPRRRHRLVRPRDGPPPARKSCAGRSPRLDRRSMTTSDTLTSRRTRPPPQARGPARRGHGAQEVPRGVRELSWLRARGPRRRRVRPLEIPTPMEDGGARAGERIGLVPILRAASGWSSDARADADGPGLAPGPVPRRAHPPAGEYYNKLPDSASRRPVPRPRPDARDRRLERSPPSTCSSVGRGQAGRIKLVNLIAARRASGPSQAATRTSRSTARRSTAASTRRATSCPASATLATASSGPATGPRP